jgi:hypothetical protein
VKPWVRPWKNFEVLACKYLRGDIDVFVNGKSPVEDIHIAVHNEDWNWSRIAFSVGPGDGLAGVLNPVQINHIQALEWGPRKDWLSPVVVSVGASNLDCRCEIRGMHGSAVCSRILRMIYIPRARAGRVARAAKAARILFGIGNERSERKAGKWHERAGNEGKTRTSDGVNLVLILLLYFSGVNVIARQSHMLLHPMKQGPFLSSGYSVQEQDYNAVKNTKEAA